MTVDANLLFNWIVSHSLATSYVDLTRANSYFLRRPNSLNWTGISESPEAVTDDMKATALMEATKAIEAYPGISDNRFVNYDANQGLFFPSEFIKNVTGYADSAGASTLVDSQLVDIRAMPDDVWNYGTIKIIDGTGIGEIFEVSDFDSVTGTITIDGSWVATLDTTTRYQLIAKAPAKIIDACCEIAYGYMPDLTTGVISDTSQRQELQAQGVTEFEIADHSETFTKGGPIMISGYLIPAKAVAILNKLQAWFA